MVPDELMLGMLKRVMSGPGAEKGWLLDGMPRTMAQAKKMTSWGFDPDAFICLDVPDDVLVARGEFAHSNARRQYRHTAHPPNNPSKSRDAGWIR